MLEAIFGFIGVILGSFLTIAKDSITAWHRRKEDGSYSAIRLICILNEYADCCLDVIDDNGTIYGQPSVEGYYYAQVQLPNPPEYPDDIAWRSLPNTLMHQILGLRNKARITNRHIDKVVEYVAFPPDFAEMFEARQKGYTKLRNDALSLVDQLSEKYQMKATHKADLDFD